MSQIFLIRLKYLNFSNITIFYFYACMYVFIFILKCRLGEHKRLLLKKKKESYQPQTFYKCTLLKNRNGSLCHSGASKNVILDSADITWPSQCLTLITEAAWLIYRPEEQRKNWKSVPLCNNGWNQHLSIITQDIYHYHMKPPELWKAEHLPLNLAQDCKDSAIACALMHSVITQNHL